MFDVNNHPKQDKLNEDIAYVLAYTVKQLSQISKDYDVDARDLAKQYRECFDKMLKQSTEDERS